MFWVLTGILGSKDTIARRVQEYCTDMVSQP